MKKILGIIVLGLLLSYLIINFFVGTNKVPYLKSLFSLETKTKIKKIFFPYDHIKMLENKILVLNGSISNLELKIIKSGSDIKTKESTVVLSNNKTLKKYQLINSFISGINNVYPGSGYIEFYEDNIIILSARGILAYKKNLSDDKENFKQIKNNINEFIGLNQYRKYQEVSLKDITILKNKVFISHIEEIKNDCWNTSIIYGDINFETIKFKRLFSSKKCVHSVKNLDKSFNPHSSGGRIVGFDDNHILFSVGEFLESYLAQDKKSLNGKVLKINTNNSKYEVISMGHRNPQGLYFDKENNFILETEHGPAGGDEINLIKLDKISKTKIPNYGWPIASAGSHYSSSKKKYVTKYPLFKSHTKHGFIEPLKSFVPSIAPSEILKISEKEYVIGSMRDKSLYFFELNKQKKIINLDRIEVFERVRDLRFYNNKLYLFMEDSASIGVINLY